MSNTMESEVMSEEPSSNNGEKQKDDNPQYDEKTQKRMLFIFLHIVIWIIWFISIYISRSTFLDTRGTNALAMIESLSPLFYITILLFIFQCAFYIRSSIENRAFNILLLVQFGFFLWYTPNYLSGFVYDPAGIYHTGVANHIPAVLNGEPFVVSSYGNDYPGSFIISHALLKITGLDIPTYVNVIFPVLYIPIFTLFWYLIVSKLFNSHIAFYSMLIAYPGLHYFKIYPSPQMMGTILVFTCLFIFIIGASNRIKILGLITFGCIFLTHPISPAIAAILVISLYIVKLPLNRPKFSIKRISVIVMAIVLFLFIAITTSFRRVMELSLNRLGKMFSSNAISGIIDIISRPHFLYREIYFLNQLVYIIYFISALMMILYIMRIGIKSHKGFKMRILSILRIIGRKRLYTLITAFLFVVFGIVLYIITSLQDLIERSLTFFILVISIFIISILMEYIPKTNMRSKVKESEKHSLPSKQKLKRAVVIFIVIWVVPMSLIFPTVAYSIGVYNSTPPSEDSGLTFLSDNVQLDDKNISISFLSQMAMYLEPPIEVSLPPGDLFDKKGLQNHTDVVVLRSIGYYYFAMRVDLSLDDNRWISYKDEVNNSFIFNKIYSNPSLEIYIRDRNE